MIRTLFCLPTSLFLGVVIQLIPSFCIADGKIYPAAAIKAIPDIPSQRALLVFRGNTETLIIENSFLGEGQDFGWILPVPVIPIQLESVSPGFLKTLNLTLHPEITHARMDSFKGLLALPKVHIQETIVRLSPMSTAGTARQLIFEFDATHPDWPNLPPDELRSALLKYLESSTYTNPFDGNPVRLEDSPGNVMISDQSGGIALGYYNREGFLIELP